MLGIELRALTHLTHSVLLREVITFDEGGARLIIFLKYKKQGQQF